MLANFSRVNAAADVDELVFLLGRVKEAARSFADLADRFRKAISSQIPPSILKHEINTVFATQAGDLLCQCWRRGMLSVYRPRFYLPGEDEPRIRYVFSWFTFIRWHLATVFKTRFRDDWKSGFAPEMDQLKGLDHHPQKDYQSAASEDANDLVVWRLSLHADVQATACDILAEELEKLAEAIEQRLGQLPGGTPAKSKGKRKTLNESKAKKKEVEKEICVAYESFYQRTRKSKADFLKQKEKWEQLIRQYFRDEMKAKGIKEILVMLNRIIDRNRS